MAQWVKNPPAMQETKETWVQSPGWEDALEGKATHPSILAWRIPQREEPGRATSPWGHKESGTTKATEHACMPVVRTWCFHC